MVRIISMVAWRPAYHAEGTAQVYAARRHFAACRGTRYAFFSMYALCLVTGTTVSRAKTSFAPLNRITNTC